VNLNYQMPLLDGNNSGDSPGPQALPAVALDGNVSRKEIRFAK
jgi:hypothetical protein